LSSSLEKRILISPIGSQDEEVLLLISTAVQTFFGCETGILPVLDNIDFAIDFKRNQYHSTVILDRLSELAPRDTLKILAVTGFDLFIPIFTYVFGEAQLGGKACIISTHRLSRDLPSMEWEEGFKKRAVKEALHELGHTFKLTHCKEKHCIMRYSRSIEDVDNKSREFCRYCRQLLDDEMGAVEAFKS